AFLADAIGAVGCLVFDGRIPPAIEVEHVVGRGQIEARASGLDREHENARALGLFLKAADHLVPRLAWRASVEKDHLDAETLPEMCYEPLAHLAKLREHECLVALRDRLFEHLDRAIELSGAASERSRVAEVLRRVIADLLEEHQERQHPPASLDTVSRLDATQLLVDHRLVQGGLLAT